MNFNKAFSSFALAALFALPPSFAYAISDQMKEMIWFETKANAVSTRDNAMVTVYHYEIPLRLLEADISAKAAPDYVRSMIFDKNGEKFVRWVLNPEDTKWHLEIEEFMKKHNLPLDKQTHFEGYRTASRSYILVDPISKAEFSLKTSTNNTGGYWADKKQYWDDSSQIRKISEYVRERMAAQPEFKHALILDEPMAFGIKEKDIGIIMRSYQDMARKGHTYVPGFSVLHTQVGAKLAAMNGSNDPAQYWNDNYNKPLARALAEFFAATGVRYDSPHSQNFMVEIDANKKPTGRIVLRDFGDAYLYQRFFDANKNMAIIKSWEKGNVVLPSLKDVALKSGDAGMSVGTLHGNTPPVWIDFVNDLKSSKSYDQWGRDFFAEYEKEFKRQTGLELRSVKEAPTRQTSKGTDGTVHKAGYFTKHYKLFVESNFLEMVFKDRQREAGAAGTCQRVLLAM